MRGPSANGLTSEDWRRQQLRRPWMLGLKVVLMALFIGTCFAGIRFVSSPTGSERHLTEVVSATRPLPWVFSHPVDPELLSRIDFCEVHTELLPAWFESLSRGATKQTRWEESGRFRVLVEALNREENLVELLDGLRESIELGPNLYLSEISTMMQAWNAYMAEQGLPWRLKHDVIGRARGGDVYVRTYRVVHDARVTVDGVPQLVRFMARADRGELVEIYLGQAAPEENRAEVVTDRVSQFVLDRVWMMMDPSGDDALTGADRRFSSLLRMEAQKSLSPTQLHQLVAGAQVYRSLWSHLKAIETRSECGSRIAVEHLPWDGLTDEGERIVEKAAAANEERGCKALTQADAEQLVARSRFLRNDESLRGALGALAAWMAKAVAVHEARHLADRHGAQNIDAGCSGCPFRFGRVTRAEVSAYLAAMATPDVGYLSLFQACDAGSSDGNASGVAVNFLLASLMPQGCGGEPPEDLYRRAAALEVSLFNRVGSVAVSDDFPQVLPLPGVVPSIAQGDWRFVGRAPSPSFGRDVVRTPFL